MQRFAPQQPWPAYTYIPGVALHPHRDSNGHHFAGCVWEPDAERLSHDRDAMGMVFWYAIDLFHAGYYWEAHEMWERCWIDVGRTGELADVVKGLIKLAAAGVKAREGRGEGVIRHATRAVEIFGKLQDARTIPDNEFAGEKLTTWIAHARSIRDHSEACLAAARALGADPYRVAPIFPFQLIE